MADIKSDQNGGLNTSSDGVTVQPQIISVGDRSCPTTDGKLYLERGVAENCLVEFQMPYRKVASFTAKHSMISSDRGDRPEVTG